MKYILVIIVGILTLMVIYSIFLFIVYKKNRNYINILVRLNNYFIKDSRRVKYLFLLSLMYSLLLVLIIDGDTNIFPLILLLITTTITGFFYIKDTLSDNNITIKITGIIFMYSYIFLFGCGLVKVIANNTNNTIVLFFGVIVFLLITISSLWSSIIYVKHDVYKLVVVLSCYGLIVTFGTWIFGLYYYYNGCWGADIISKFNSLDSSWITLWQLSKYTLGGFYNYPDKGTIRFVSILQYFIGKFLDLFLLGYIVNVIFEMSKKINKKNKTYTVTIKRQILNK
ncbi:hypothetical protein [Inconstantimicrobium mannanitabidum]|uniref:Uncharacterized protein n=1 Tax=Inconstantimicrobium mannanitabidum TaxID=1604901 RepID=A0ACB5R9J1_9CLOT|nr:hypothetical protein [Clostridium sp. TW13]GKX65858.1 hypothetical protein rsdtw13_11160 [Clostridium sp. TW13]